MVEQIHPTKAVKSIWKRLCEAARLMIGVPDYEAYLDHMRRTHPDEKPMSYEAFFRNRQDARYGGKGKGGFRCC